jgi:hypothetical protein
MIRLTPDTTKKGELDAARVLSEGGHKTLPTLLFDG